MSNLRERVKEGWKGAMKKKWIGSNINILLSVYMTVIAVALRGYHAYYLFLCFIVFYEGLVYVK